METRRGCKQNVEEMTDCIWNSAKEVLGVSRVGSGRLRGAWWWGEEVKEKVKAKQERYKALVDSRIYEKKEVNRVTLGLREGRQREQWR